MKLPGEVLLTTEKDGEMAVYHLHHSLYTCSNLMKIINRCPKSQTIQNTKPLTE